MNERVSYSEVKELIENVEKYDENEAAVKIATGYLDLRNWDDFNNNDNLSDVDCVARARELCQIVSHVGRGVSRELQGTAFEKLGDSYFSVAYDDIDMKKAARAYAYAHDLLAEEHPERAADVLFRQGVAYQCLGKKCRAKRCWRKLYKRYNDKRGLLSIAEVEMQSKCKRTSSKGCERMLKLVNENYWRALDYFLDVAHPSYDEAPEFFDKETPESIEIGRALVQIEKYYKEGHPDKDDAYAVFHFYDYLTRHDEFFENGDENAPYTQLSSAAENGSVMSQYYLGRIMTIETLLAKRDNQTDVIDHCYGKAMQSLLKCAASGFRPAVRCISKLSAIYPDPELDKFYATILSKFGYKPSDVNTDI